MAEEKIFDWKGNEVKAGMTIYFVRTKNLSFGRLALMTPTQGLVYIESEEDYEKRKNEDVWELGEPLEVVWQQGRLCTLMIIKNDPDIEQIIFPITSMFGEKPIIAIKELSDKK